jgi:Pentapeptide repeats (8 copies)
MDLEEALKLLTGGDKGVDEWNSRRWKGEMIPSLQRVRLTGVHLTAADLYEANFSRAIFRGSDFRWANFNETDLSKADLRRANLSGVFLDKADLTSARCGGTTFANVDLSKTKGLEFVRHDRPSSIGLDTIIMSHGKIPEVFLRGCGVPDVWIDNIPALEAIR